MIEFAFAIVIIFVLIAGHAAIKAAAALEDSSNSYLEGVLVDNSIERQIRSKELEERMKEIGVDKLIAHEEFLRKLGRQP